MADVKYVITVDETGATKKIETFDKAVESLGKTSQSTGSHAKSFGESLMGKLVPAITVADLAADAIKKTLGFLKDTIADSIQGAAEAERVDRALESALYLTGKSAMDAGGHFGRYAKELQRSTIYDDEAIKKTQALLVQLTNLDRDGLDKATKGAIGLASVLGIDLDSAATLVQKAMSGNIEVLSRYGIKIDETLSAEEKQAALMGKLLGFYGRAEAEANTYAGRVDQLKGAYDDLLESIGNFVVKNPEVIAALEGVRNIVSWLGEYIPRNAQLINMMANAIPALRGLQDSLRLIAAAGKYAAADLKVLAEREEEGEKTALALWDSLVKNANAAKIFGVNLGPIIQYLDQLMNQKPGVSTLDQLFKDLGIKTVPQLKTELANAEKALALFNATGVHAPGIVSSLEKKVSDAKEQLYGIQEPLAAFTQKLMSLARSGQADLKPIKFSIRGDTWEPMVSWLTKLPAATNKFGASLDALAPKIFKFQKSGKEAFQELADKAQKTMAKIQVYTSAAFAGMNAIISQAQTNREIAIENEYKKRLAAIEANITDEDARQKAIEALEAEYEIKKTSARRKAAKEEKAVALMSATMNTAQGITSALAMFPPNLILAAIVAAMGAVQIGTIAAQPIPLARGGYFKEPTVLAGAGGQSYLVDEAVPNRGEIVSPVPVMRQIVREETRGGGRTVNLGGVTVNIYAQTLDDRTIRQAGDKIVAVVKARLRNDTAFAGAY